ncbi:pectin lyase fold/virulence factor [Infundibulicybe gibba]|nr:pectin lyase fold/virulence factor [Infundibulicybe gibba]
MLSAFAILSLAGIASVAEACTGTISSLADVAAAVACTTVNINGFTVPGGSALTLNLLTGTTVNMNGDILFGNKSWVGPLFTVSGTSITFNGNNHKFDGGGPFYWDDCLAINRGSNIVFKGNTCSGGHGISVGSIDSDATVSGVVISGNTIINNDQALRIKTDAAATGSSVTNVTYSSYPSTIGTPGSGVKLSRNGYQGVNFVAPVTTITVNSGAQRAAVNCGVGSCTGSWNWSNLKISGGKAGAITNFNGITGFTP